MKKYQTGKYAEYRMQNTECRMQNAECRSQKSEEYKIFELADILHSVFLYYFPYEIIFCVNVYPTVSAEPPS